MSKAKFIGTDTSYNAGWNYRLDLPNSGQHPMPRMTAKWDEFYRGYWDAHDACIEACRENLRTGNPVVKPTRK